MFGSGSGFGGAGSGGTSGGFGSSSGGFGQPKLGTGFGSTGSGFGQGSGTGSGTTGAFGASSSTAATGGFGGFGRSTTGGFGSTGGGFGSTSSGTATTGGGFGQSTGAFGQPSQAPSVFGGASAAPATGFGQTGGFGLGAGVAAVGSGTTRAKFEAVPENPEGGRGNLISHICAMDAYKAFSPEELRLEDYEAGRKKAEGAPAVGGFGQAASGGFGASTPGGFGASTGSTGFGQTSAPGGFGASTSGGFGSSAGTGAFGAATPSRTGFGQTATGGFGSSGTGAFGSTPAASTGGGFGQAATGGFGQTSTLGGFGSSTGGFGQTATSSGFGQTATPGGFGQSAGTGAFGAKPTFGAGTGAFGATSQPAAATGGFGQTTGGFGANTGSSLFGSGNTGAAAGGAFGQPAASGAASTGLFGQSTSAAGSTGGGLFGAKPATGGSLFGASGSTFGQPAAATSGTGMFGQSTGAAGSTGGGLFGQSTGSTGTGLFGAKPAAAPAAGGGLFGSTGSTFGQPAAAAPSGTGMFGAQPAAAGATGGGLFGSSTAAAGTSAAGATGGLFGSAGATGGGGLFGAKPATMGTGGGGLFGQSTGTAGGGLFGGGQAAGAQTALQPAGQPQLQQSFMFGQPAAQQPALQPTQLQAQIDKQPYGVSALFDTSKLASKAAAAGTRVGSSHLTATPLRAGALSQAAGEKETERKKRGLSLQLLASPRVATAASSRMRSRGFAAPSAASVAHKAAATAASVAATPASKGREVTGMFGRDGFLSPAGQLPHSNVKRLVITRKPSFGAGSAAASDTRDVAAHGGMAVSADVASPPRMDNPWADTPHARTAQPTPAKPRSASVAVAAADDDEFNGPSVVAEQDYDLAPASDVDDDDDDSGGDGAGGEYWMRPSLDDLRAMSTLQLRAVRNFTVGREGVGQVSFNKPVDLTSVGALSGIAGGVVLFDDRVCTVYPDESNKPPRGQGLNVPATISLHDCWPVDRTTGERIVRMEDPRVRSHIRRLRKIEETEFVDFVGGTWIFRVEHFSRYGLDDNRESGYEDEDLDQTPQQGFGKAAALAPAQQTQSHLGGSRAVATRQNQQPNPTRPVSCGQHLRALSAADGGSGSETDVLATSSQSDDEDPAAREPVVPVTQRPPPRQLLLSARHAESLRRAPVMRVSLFSTTSEPGSGMGRRPAAAAAAAVAVPQTQPSGCKRKGSVLRGSPARRAQRVRATALDLPQPFKYLRTSESRVARNLLAAPQPYEQSLTHGRSGVSADAGLMMARSFRVAFGPQGQLVYLHSGASSSVVVVDSIARHLHAAPGSAALLARAADADGAALDAVRQQHLGVVRAQWEHALIRADGSPCPRVTFRQDATIASVLESLSRVAPAAESGSGERRVLELAAVLFDGIRDSAGDLTPEQQARARTVQQRQALTKWLMAAVYPAVQSDLRRAGQSTAPAAASVLALLTGHRIEAACLAATSHRDYRLATLVAQCGAGAIGGGGNDQQVQSLVRSQLDRMAATATGGRTPDMAPEYRRVYEVLAGNATGAVAAGVDWQRAFGLALWYAQSPADPISGAVASYECEAQRADLATAAPPLPGWLFAGNDGAALATASASQIQRATGEAARRSADLHQRGVWDAAFQLLKLHSSAAYPLENALPSESFSAARGDVRLPAVVAWLLAVVCGSRGFDDARRGNDGGAWTSAVYDRLLAGWALQLESLGLWHWACFVLLQLSSGVHKAHAIRALLERSLPSSHPTSTLPAAAGGDLLLRAVPAGDDAAADAVEEQIRFVLYELQLPRAWLFDAYVTRSRYDRDWAEARAQQPVQLQSQSQAVGHSVQLAAAQRTTASGRPIMPSFFNQQQQQPTAQDAGAAFRRSVLAREPLDAGAEAVLRQVVWQLSAGRLAAAHALVLQRIAPDAILRGDHRLLSRILERLDPQEYAGVAAEAWAAGGQVYQQFITAVDGLPAVLQRIAAASDDGVADMEAATQQVHAIYRQLCQLQTVLPALLAQFDGVRGIVGFYDGSEANWYAGAEACDLRVKYSVAVSDMAAVVTGLVQELKRAVPILEDGPRTAGAPADATVDLPLAHDMRIRCTYELARSCFGSLVTSGLDA